MSSDPPAAHPPLPQPLRRARDGRWLGGVCRGVATRWGIPVAQVRALFAVAGALAGIGVLAYVACWLVLPAEAEDEAPSLLGGLVSLALIAAACAGLLTLAFAAGLATLFGFGWAVAATLSVFLAGSLVAWPVVRPTWVLLPLVAAALPAVAVAASGVRIAPQTGVVVAEPRTSADIPASGYRTGLGELLVDLRRFRAAPDERVALRLETGIGRTVVALPRDRCFDLDVTYRSGRAGADAAGDVLSFLDWRWSSFAESQPIVFYGQHQVASRGQWTRASDDPHAPTLAIDFTSVGGELWVRDYPDSTGPLYEPYWPHNVQPPLRPDARRWGWRKEVRRPAVQRRWREWRKQVMRFEQRRAALVAGACATEVRR
jgi:phage shock protein PspC (stress-responsive transcriptional regulator)